jgi:hypothetical protein
MILFRADLADVQRYAGMERVGGSMAKPGSLRDSRPGAGCL